MCMSIAENLVRLQVKGNFNYDAMFHISLLKLVGSSCVRRRQVAIKFSKRSFSFEEEAEKRPFEQASISF